MAEATRLMVNTLLSRFLPERVDMPVYLQIHKHVGWWFGLFARAEETGFSKFFTAFV